MEVEVLMKRMVELQQQQEEEECTQEEMVTRFESQRSESIPTGTTMDTVVSCMHIILMNFQPSDQLTRCIYLTDFSSCHHFSSG